MVVVHLTFSQYCTDILERGYQKVSEFVREKGTKCLGPHMSARLGKKR